MDNKKYDWKSNRTKGEWPYTGDVGNPKYEKDRSELFAEANIRLTTLTDYTNIIGLAAEKGFIPEDQLDVVLKFKENPAEWGNEMGF